MNITRFQNNNAQSFGMAYRMKRNAAERIAQEIHSSSLAHRTEDFFVNNIAKPLKELTTEVVADGERVFIEHPVTKMKFEVVDTLPFPAMDGHTLTYYLKHIENGRDFHYPVRYSFGDNAVAAKLIREQTSGLMRKHIMAREVARCMDAQLPKATNLDQQALNSTASKLKNLFG